jgi:Pyridoxamine 5'-phosphate oxidase
VSATLPAAARRALEEATFCHVAARTERGPHLTPVVFVLDGGALWMTTSRASAKARAWRRDPFVAGMVRTDTAAVVFRGRVRIHDALDPHSWPPVSAGPAVARAGARFALRNARFFAGYAVDAPRVPFAWGPGGRQFVRLTLDDGMVVDPATGERVAAWGSWPARGSVAFLPSFAAAPRRRPLDLRAPADIRDAVGTSGDGALAVEGRDGPLVLPVRWRRRPAEAAYEACLPATLLRPARATARPRVGLEIDRPGEWRAGQMAGMLLRGEAEVFSIGATRVGAAALGERVPAGWALVRLCPSRVVWWRGWTSGTVSV